MTKCETDAWLSCVEYGIHTPHDRDPETTVGAIKAPAGTCNDAITRDSDVTQLCHKCCRIVHEPVRFPELKLMFRREVRVSESTRFQDASCWILHDCELAGASCCGRSGFHTKRTNIFQSIPALRPGAMPGPARSYPA